MEFITWFIDAINNIVKFFQDLVKQLRAIGDGKDPTDPSTPDETDPTE